MSSLKRDINNKFKMACLFLTFILFTNLINTESDLSSYVSQDDIDEFFSNHPYKKETDSEFSNNTDILILDDNIFDREIKNIECALIEYVVPWCHFCQTLQPVFENAAAILKKENNPKITLIRIDSDKNKNISEAQNITSYPTLKFYKDGVFTEYEGTKNSGRELAIQVKRFCNSNIIEYDSLAQIFDDALDYLNILIVFRDKKDSNGALFATLNSLHEFHQDILFAFCPLEYPECNPKNVSFENLVKLRNARNSISNETHLMKFDYENQVFEKLINDLKRAFEDIKSNENIIFINNANIDRYINNIKNIKNYKNVSNFATKENLFSDFNSTEFPADSKFISLYEKLNYFININGYDLANNFEDRIAEIVFSINTTSLFFFRNASTPYRKYDEIILEAAEKLKGKVYFVLAQLESELEMKVGELLYLENEELPQLRIFHILNDEEIRTYLLDFNFTHPITNFTSDIIMDFYNKFNNNELKPYYKSEPTPSFEANENNKTLAVKKLVGATYNDFYYNLDKNRVILIYLPWDYSCKKMRPIYQQVAEKYKNYEDLIFTELDYSKNEVSSNVVKVYPSIYFYKKGEKYKNAFLGEYSLEDFENFILQNMELPPIIKMNDVIEKKKNDKEIIKGNMSLIPLDKEIQNLNMNEIKVEEVDRSIEKKGDL